MSRPLIIFGDPLMGTLAVLHAAEPPAGPAPTFGTVEYVPDDSGAPSLPYVLVAVDGETSNTIADSTATVRVTVWASSAVAARAVAGWARAVLLASYGDGTNVRHFGRGIGLLPTTDPDSDTPLCTFTVAARLLPL